MGVVPYALLIAGGFFLVWSFTGGFAGAIAARGREDRSLLANAGIGFVGWLAAAVIWTVVDGEWPEEFSFGLAFLALACSVGYLLIRKRWSSRRQDRVLEEAEPVD